MCPPLSSRADIAPFCASHSKTPAGFPAGADFLVVSSLKA